MLLFLFIENDTIIRNNIHEIFNIRKKKDSFLVKHIYLKKEDTCLYN